MAEYSIVFTGPKGAGKTSAINALSEVPVKSAEMDSTDGALGTSKSISNGLEYGRIQLSDDAERINLYGICGEVGLGKEVGKITECGLGLIMLLDNSRPKPIEDMHFFLREFADLVKQTAMVIGITRMELKHEPKIEDYHRELWTSGVRAPILEVDTRNKRDIVILAKSLIYQLDPGLGR